jgi:hypothetical protein
MTTLSKRKLALCWRVATLGQDYATQWHPFSRAMGSLERFSLGWQPAKCLQDAGRDLIGRDSCGLCHLGSEVLSVCLLFIVLSHGPTLYTAVGLRRQGHHRQQVN